MLIYIVVVLITLLLVYIYRPIKRYPIQKDTVILITGACMGIGRQMALELAKIQCTLILIDKREELANTLLTELRSQGASAHFYCCDLSNIEQVQTTLKSITAHNINIVINNAGIGIFQLFKQQSIDQYITSINVNCIAPQVIISQLMMNPHLQHIVNICSVASIVPGMKITSYCASKHGLWGYHNSLRMELKHIDSRVRTTLIAPWGINTGMIKGLKTKLDKLFPILDECYVANQIILAIECHRDIVFIPWYQYYVAYLSRLLPTYIIDTLCLYLQAQHINEFVGR